jgi:hypothetical protein
MMAQRFSNRIEPQENLQRSSDETHIFAGIGEPRASFGRHGNTCQLVRQAELLQLRCRHFSLQQFLT